MYQLRLAAGKLLAELQLAVSSSPGLYRGSVPLITGPSSGRSKKYSLEKKIFTIYLKSFDIQTTTFLANV